MSKIKQWFEAAVPTPTKQTFNVQLGCHLEEIHEMLCALDCNASGYDVLKFVVDQVSRDLKLGIATAKPNNPVELLDGLCDQVVTATGVGHMLGYDFNGALAEVDSSNWSKFVNGKPVFDSNGKIAKGVGYHKPNLEAYVKVQ